MRDAPQFVRISMSQKADVGSRHFSCARLPKPPQHPPSGRRPKNAMARKVHPSEKIDTGIQRF